MYELISARIIDLTNQKINCEQIIKNCNNLLSGNITETQRLKLSNEKYSAIKRLHGANEMIDLNKSLLKNIFNLSDEHEYQLEN